MANTTSGSYTFEKNFAIDDIISEAYERIGLVGSAGHQIHSARRSLNILFQEWGNRGIHFWEVGDTNIDLIEGQAEYTFYRSTDDGTSSVTVGGTSGASTYGLSDVLSAQYRTDRTSTSQTDLPMTKVSRSTYAAFSNKLTKSTPSSTAASKDMHIYFVKRIQDAGAYTNATDAPYRFVPCMTAGLAFYLSQKYAPQRSQELKLYYEDELARALAEDGSAASTYITPKTYYPNI